MEAGRRFLACRPWWRILPAIALATLLAGCQFQLGSPVSLFDDEAAIARAIDAMSSRFNGPVPTLKVEISENELVIQAANPLMSRQIVEWRLVREDYSLLTWDRMYGPRSIQPVLLNRTFEANLFNLRDVNLAGWPKLADAAIAHAALEDKGGLSRIEIARPVSILSEAASGPVRWTFEVKSPRESAKIYANASGDITGANLNGTLRMRNLDMYQRPELVVDAAGEIRRQTKNSPVLINVSFSSKSINFETTLRDDNFPIKFSGGGMQANTVYSWSYDGLGRAMGRVSTRGHFSNPDAPFGVDEVDWEVLPKIVANARTALAMPNGKITSIDLSKPTSGVGMPVPVWKIDIEENRERGTYAVDTKDVVKNVLLPKSRRPQTNWLNPGTVADTLQRIEQEFGPNAKFESIAFRDGYVEVNAIDPRKPGELVSVHLRENGFSRWGSPMFPGPRDRDFAAEDLRQAQQSISASVGRALADMKMPSGNLDRITIGRANALQSRKKGITIEVRAVAGNAGNWAVYEADGSFLGAWRR